MIFAKTIDLVLSGRKTQTVRIAQPGDTLGPTADGKAAVFHPGFHMAGKLIRPTRWVTGRTYAVQRQRCHRAEGRIRVTYLREVLDPTSVDIAFVRAEGFDDTREYLRIWHELHKSKPVQRCWAIGFELVKGNQR